MSTDMIERVAQVLCEWVGHDDWTEESRIRYREGARKFIEAMREPTEDMVRSLDDSHGRLWADNEAANVWRSMVNAATGVSE